MRGQIEKTHMELSLLFQSETVFLVSWVILLVFVCSVRLTSDRHLIFAPPRKLRVDSIRVVTPVPRVFFLLFSPFPYPSGPKLGGTGFDWAGETCPRTCPVQSDECTYTRKIFEHPYASKRQPKKFLPRELPVYAAMYWNMFAFSHRSLNIIFW